MKYFSKRELEGYVMIDCRESPGITEEEARQGPPGTLPIPAGVLFESATMKCSHCPVHVILRPERTRNRGYCPKCDHFVCDKCELERVLTGVCNPTQKRLDDWFEKALKGE